MTDRDSNNRIEQPPHSQARPATEYHDEGPPPAPPPAPPPTSPPAPPNAGDPARVRERPQRPPQPLGPGPSGYYFDQHPGSGGAHETAAPEPTRAQAGPPERRTPPPVVAPARHNADDHGPPTAVFGDMNTDTPPRLGSGGPRQPSCADDQREGGESAPVASYSYVEGFRTSALVPSRKVPPGRGWRRALYKSTFGLINLGRSPDER